MESSLSVFWDSWMVSEFLPRQKGSLQLAASPASNRGAHIYFIRLSSSKLPICNLKGFDKIYTFIWVGWRDLNPIPSSSLLFTLCCWCHYDSCWREGVVVCAHVSTSLGHLLMVERVLSELKEWLREWFSPNSWHLQKVQYWYLSLALHLPPAQFTLVVLV